MKRRLIVFVVLLSGLMSTSGSLAQGPRNATEEATDLRAQLVEVQARQADLQNRLNRLNDDLKPENIARSLAGIGSTRPEELREQRRKELSIESDGVRKQLDLLATSRAHLESAVQVADNRAYQQSARGFVINKIGGTSFYGFDLRWVLIPIVTIVGILGTSCLVACGRRA